MRRGWIAALLTITVTTAASAQTVSCGSAPLQVQILTSGGAESFDGGTSGILVWIQGKSRLLVDAGPGTALHFAQTGASVADLDALLFTHLRLERTGDFPALLQLSTAAKRNRALPTYGPGGNRLMPSTVSFVRSLFDPTRGAWRYLGDLLSPLTRAPYKLDPH